MYHLNDNLFFGRTKDDKVRIVKLKPEVTGFPELDGPEHPDAVFDITTDLDAFSSVVAGLTKTGENGATWEAARKFFDS